MSFSELNANQKKLLMDYYGSFWEKDLEKDASEGGEISVEMVEFFLLVLEKHKVEPFSNDGNYGGDDIVKGYGSGKDKIDPNLDKAQWNSKEAHAQVRLIMKSALQATGENANMEEVGTMGQEEVAEKDRIPGWLFFCKQQMDLGEGAYLKLVIDAFANDDTIKSGQVDLTAPHTLLRNDDGTLLTYPDGDIQKVTNDKPIKNALDWKSINKKVTDKTTWITRYNKFLADNKFPNPLTDYKEPHQIPYNKWVDKPKDGKYTYNDGDWVDVTAEKNANAKKEGKEEVVFAGWKQDEVNPKHEERYFYIELTKTELGNDTSQQKINDERKKKFQEMQKKPVVEKPCKLVCDLSYYLVYNKKLEAVEEAKRAAELLKSDKSGGVFALILAKEYKEASDVSYRHSLNNNPDVDFTFQNKDGDDAMMLMIKHWDFNEQAAKDAFKIMLMNVKEQGGIGEDSESTYYGHWNHNKKTGQSHMIEAANIKNWWVVTQLIIDDGDYDYKNKQGETILSVAEKHGNYATICEAVWEERKKREFLEEDSPSPCEPEIEIRGNEPIGEEGEEEEEEEEEEEDDYRINNTIMNSLFNRVQNQCCGKDYV
jgi:hypothetical protein